MSDCRVPMSTYRANRVTVRFADAEPWSYPIAERGEVVAVEVDGVRYERVVHCRECRHWHFHRCELNDEWRDEREYCWCGEAGA